MNNLLDILNKSVNYLEKKKIKNSRITVEKIFSEILDMQRIMLYANFEKILSEKEIEKIREKLNNVIQGNNEEMDFNVSEKENENDNLKSLIDKSTAYLEKNNINEARLITEIIFSHVLNVDRMLLFTLYKTEVKKEKLNKIRNYIQKIGKEKFPLQYLLNEQEFYGRKFYVNKGVLIPRQDTEVLVEEAIKILKKDKIQNPKILDIGTGSGVIGLTVALEIPDSKVMGTDISEKALEISEKNKKLLNVENIKFFKSNLFENIEYKKFDMIISNPPYISDNEIGVMSEDTLLHEPDEALFAENNGLFFYYEICRNGMNYLQNNGYLLFEIGYRQGEVVKEIVKKAGFKNVNIIKDMQNNDRVVAGQNQMEKNEVESFLLKFKEIAGEKYEYKKKDKKNGIINDFNFRVIIYKLCK